MADRPTGPAPRPHGPEPASDRTGIEGVLEFRRRVLALGFGIITLSVLALLVAIYLQLANPILWGLALAVLFFPLHRAILRLVRGRATLAAAISTVLSLAIIFLPSAFLITNLIDEVQNLWPRIQAVLGPQTYEAISRSIEESPFRGMLRWMIQGDPRFGAADIEAELQRIALSVQDFLLERLRSITRSVPGAFIRVGITVIVFFFFLRHGPGWVGQARDVLPLAPQHSARLFTIAERTLNAVFRGVMVTAATQAILAGAGYWVVGAPTPLLLASVTFIAALIPFVGPIAVWLPVVAGLALTGRVPAALGLAAWGTLVVSLVDNVLRPYLIGKETRLPVLWLFLAILGGLKLFGFLGVLVGPITLALAAACYRIYMETRRTPV
jgi:predicted PurR-regulated permease PerM